MDQLITVGQIDSSDTLGTTLHQSALNGNKKSLKKVLDKGIHVDYPNDEGQTPLFCASLNGHEGVVEYLLASAADANEKSNLGLTPMHAACFSGNIQCLMKLLKVGGDLRLHDYQGRSVKDWAMLNPNPKKRMKILEFLDKTRMFAMSGSGQDLLLGKASSKTLYRANKRRNTITAILGKTFGRPSISKNLERMASSHHTVGFGQVYSSGSISTGFVSAIPLVNENSLRHDKEGLTYNNGAFAVMERSINNTFIYISMWWDYSKVTVKRLHRDLDPYQGGVVDLLINEIEHIGKLRHPNILTLMGVCQTSNLDGLILVYETVTEGSLFNYMHHRMEILSTEMINDLALQLCNAIIFIHLRGLVHCALSSHAVHMVNMHTFKLGNFEYMIEACKCEWGKKNAVATNTSEHAVYNWMSPEVMINMPPSYYCDMYSYCAVLWEIFHGEIPWYNQCAESIKSHYSKGHKLNVYNGQIADYYGIILEHGLQQDPTSRKLSFLHVRDILQAAPKDAKAYFMAHLKYLHPCDSSQSGGGGGGGSSPQKTPGPSSTGHLSGHFSGHRSLSSGHPSYSGYPAQGSTHPSAPPRVPGTGGTDGRQHVEQHQQSRSKEVHDHKKWGKAKDSQEKHSHAGSSMPHRESEKKDRMNEGRRQWAKDVERQKISCGFTHKSRQVRDPNNNQNCNVEPGALMRWAREVEDGLDLRDFVPPKPNRQHLHYTSDGLSWESVPQEIGEEYMYTVKVKREPSPSKSNSPCKGTSPSKNMNCQAGDREQTISYVQDVYASPNHIKRYPEQPRTSYSTSSGQSTSTESHVDSDQYAKGRDLTRKTSSMGNFTYMTLGPHCRTRSAGAKPASHVQSDMVAEPYSTSGKLSTAGSLYALYNEHSPDLPRGQLEQSREPRPFSTLPRTRNKPLFDQGVKPEANWFGGQGSVRDLAQVFQQQIQQHGIYQSVLDGTVNKHHSHEELKQSTDRNIFAVARDYGNHASVRCPDGPGSTECYGSVGSLTTVSMSSASENIHQIAFDVDEGESGSTMTSDVAQVGSDGNTDSAAESDIVTQWVDHELRKIKRNLSKELIAKQSVASVQSPDLFERSFQSDLQSQKNNGANNVPDTHPSQDHLHQYNGGQNQPFNNCKGQSQVSDIIRGQGHVYEDSEGTCSSLVTPETSDTSLPSDRQDMGDRSKYSPVQEFYFDDEMYMTETSAYPRQTQSNGYKEHQGECKMPSCREESPVKPKPVSQSTLPMKTILKKTKPSSDDSSAVPDCDRYDGKKRRVSKIPTSHRSSQSRTKLGDTPAYTSTVTVRSCLDDAGTHQVTHKMRNLKTGSSKTLLNDTVTAKKVTTKFKTAKL